MYSWCLGGESSRTVVGVPVTVTSPDSQRIYSGGGRSQGLEDGALDEGDR
jgi:hypothetical protein